MPLVILTETIVSDHWLAEVMLDNNFLNLVCIMLRSLLQNKSRISEFQDAMQFNRILLASGKIFIPVIINYFSLSSSMVNCWVILFCLNRFIFPCIMSLCTLKLHQNVFFLFFLYYYYLIYFLIVMYYPYWNTFKKMSVEMS